MPNNAPDVSVATANYRRVSFRYVDVSGDKIAHSIQVAPAITPAQIQALGVAFGAASNASLYEIIISDSWATVPSASNAVDATKSNSVFDAIVMQYKNAENQGERLYVPAPVDAAFQADTDNVDPADALITALKTAGDAVLASYTAIGYRYNEKRELNTQVRI